MRVLDWHKDHPDALIKSGEMAIHEELHASRAEQKRTREQILAGKRMRVAAIDRALAEIGSPVSGRVLEVGAGDGWCSAYMQGKFNIDELYVMEIDRPAVERLIPATFASFGARTDNVVAVRGSFNRIQMTEHFDWVVAMGALHHSSNLYATLSSIRSCLRPGGWLLAQEPAMSDDTLNRTFVEREREEVLFQGLKKVSNVDRTDLFYRRCEYRTAAFHAGLEVRLVELRRWWQRPRRGKLGNVLVLAQRPKGAFADASPPTRWEHAT